MRPSGVVAALSALAALAAGCAAPPPQPLPPTGAGATETTASVPSSGTPDPPADGSAAPGSTVVEVEAAPEPLFRVDQLGVYRGPCDTGGVDHFARWLGTDVGLAVDFLGWKEWKDTTNPSWWVNCWAGSSQRLSLGVPLIPREGGTLRAGAAGEYDHRFRQMAEALVAGGLGDTIIRLGWEGNGSWFPWRAGAGPADYVAYWRRVAEVIRSVPGGAFKLEWTLATGPTETPGEAMYPGDDVVDIIGITIYDAIDEGGPIRPWSYHLERTNGVAHWARFAAERGKPLAVPEWGVTEDHPDFVTGLISWAATADVLYLAYYDSDDSPLGAHRLSGDAYPRSADRLRELISEADR